VFKVLDYGIFLKLDTADGYQLQLGRMLKIFILLGCSEYAECTAMHMNTLAYMKIHDTPTWRLIVNHFNCHNEELGEMSFSVLSRAMLGDNHKHKLDHMNEMYKLTALYRNVCGEMKVQVGHLYKKEHSNRNVDMRGPEVRRISRYMREVVRSFHDNSYTQYDGSARSYKSSDYAEEHQIFVFDPPLLWKDDISQDVFDLVQHCGRKYTRPWVQNHADIWPESADNHNGVYDKSAYADSGDGIDDSECSNASDMSD